MRIDDDELPSDLPDSARMQRVEASLAFQKRLIIVLGAVTVILLSSFATGALMVQRKHAQAPSAIIPVETGETGQGELRKRLAVVEKDLESSRQELIALTTALQRLQVVERTGQVDQMNAVLQEQERAFRVFLRNLKDGMFDLSRMVAGSRTWLDEYNQRIDQLIAESRAREARLGEISSLELPVGAAADQAEAASAD